jgi:hypothetical protein
MAISPEYLNKAFIREVEDFEFKLDEKLSKNSIEKGETINLDVPLGMNSKHFNLLKTRYISAGWSDVKMNSDQREGTWLTFYY